MADEVQDIDKTNDMESQIKSAILSRSSYFQDQAEYTSFSFTFSLFNQLTSLQFSNLMFFILH